MIMDEHTYISVDASVQFIFSSSQEAVLLLLAL
jgi:hypothetical protein